MATRVKKEGRLHLRLDAELLTAIRAYATRHGVTLSELVVADLRRRLYDEHLTKILSDPEQI